MKKRLPELKVLSPTQRARIKEILPGPEPVMNQGVKIPVYEPLFSGNEEQYVKTCLQSSWISSVGKFVLRFEAAFAKTVSKTKFAISVNSGSSALHVALAALGIGPGDEVILPTFTMIATMNAVVSLGATPILIDADPVTWNVDVLRVDAKVTHRTKAIIVVHVYGCPADMNPILSLAKKYHLWIIEDAAEAPGAEYHRKRVGGIGDVAAFSLYANKPVTTGEGGIVTTNNSNIAQRVYLLRNHAFTEKRHFWHQYLGYGYRMSSLQAAVGLAQVEQFSKTIEKKRGVARLYTKLLSKLPCLTLPVESQGVKHIYWMYGIVINDTRSRVRDALRAYLADNGIETRSFFIPMHLQPIYYQLFTNYRFPVSEWLCQQGLYLPSSPNLTIQQLAFICDKIASFFSRKNQLSSL